MSSALLLFVVLLAFPTGQVSSQCYTTADCTEDTVPVSGEVACCAESDDGFSYHNGEDCIACIGLTYLASYMYNITEFVLQSSSRI